MDNQGLLHNPRFVRALIVVAVLIILFTAACFLGGEAFYKTATDLASPVVALAVTILAIKTHQDKRVDASRSVWLGMAWGFGLWAIADILWAAFSIFLNDDVPYPSVADLAWLAAYIPLYIALIKRLTTLKVEPTRNQVNFLRIFGAIWLILTFIFVLLPIIITFEAERALEGLASITYPLADMVLAILSCQVLVMMQRGRFSLSWRLIFAGMLLMAFSDQIYSYATWQEVYYPETGLNRITVLIDATYIFSYVLVALGIYVYRVTWELKDTFTLGLETMASSRYYTFLGTDKADHIISLSDNFYYLVGAQPGASLMGQPLNQVLGITDEELQALNKRIAGNDFLVHHPFTIHSAGQPPLETWITAKAFYDTDGSYSGASMVFTAEFAAPEEARQPRNAELLSMMNYLISLAGSRPKDEIQTIRTYFLEMIRMLSSMLYHFGGPRFKDAFFGYLAQQIEQKDLPIKISDEVITLSEEFEGEVLASALVPLLQDARDYVCDLVGERAVNEEIDDFEKQLDSTALRDLDKYHLRAFHAV